MTTDLAVFSDPASVAVVGASDDPAKWGYWLASGALQSDHRRRISLVNSRSTSVLGHPCATSVAALDHTPDLVALCVPAGHVDAVHEGHSGLLADDDAEFARLLARICTDASLRERLSTGALGHAAQFTWASTATRIMETLADEALALMEGLAAEIGPTMRLPLVEGTAALREKFRRLIAEYDLR